jgi:hypothetical protein
MEKGDKFLYIPSESVGKDYVQYAGKVVTVVQYNEWSVIVKAEDGKIWTTCERFLRPVPKVKLAHFPYSYGKVDWHNLIGKASDDAAVKIDKKTAEIFKEADKKMNDHGIDALRYGLSLEHTPDHYSVGGIDVWKYAEMKFSHEANVGFHIINTIKYATRYEHKNGLDDLIKARDSINKAIELIEKRQPKKMEDEEILAKDEAWWRHEHLKNEAASSLSKVICDKGYEMQWHTPTMAIMDKISGFDPDYRSKNSSARGLFGFLDSTRKTYSKNNTDWNNPLVQISKGLNYIVDRYGNPHKALEFLNEKGWF